MLSIVTAVYNRPKQLEQFLHYLTLQTCKDFEVIIVDDFSVEDIYTVVRQYESKLDLKYIRLGKNFGQCYAINTGLKEVSGQTVVITEADCIPSKEFVAVHSIARLPKTVFIGAHSIELGANPIAKVMQNHESNRPLVESAKKNLQLPSVPSHFLNVSSRNISLLTEDLPKDGKLFDTDFSYSLDSKSGFGWEDTEVGCRLKQQGFNFRYMDRAFSIHYSHPPAIKENLKAAKSARNFYKLLSKHPFLFDDPETNNWVQKTYNKISTWILRSGGVKTSYSVKQDSRAIICKVVREQEPFLPIFLEQFLSNSDWNSQIILVETDGFRSRVARYYQECSPLVTVVNDPFEAVIANAIKSQKGVVTYSDYKVVAPPFPSAQQTLSIECGKFAKELEGFTQLRTSTKSQLLSRPAEVEEYKPAGPLIKTEPGKLRILSYKWHVGHQYELQKIGHQFTYVSLDGRVDWNYESRPLGSNVMFRRWDDINEKDYDVAILHFDENVLNPEMACGRLGLDWGMKFKNMMSEVTQIPKIAICHGTPPFHGMFDVRYTKKDLMTEKVPEKEYLVKYLAGIPVICNSHKAMEQWGFSKSRTIWHGMDISDYPISTYRKGGIYVANSIRARPHYRGYYWFKKLQRKHMCSYLGGDEAGEFRTVSVRKPSGVANNNAYAKQKFKNYVDVIRDHSIFLNTTLRSPMPRSRTEGMLCGLAVVTTNFHDEDMFIENGKDGFIGTSVEELDEAMDFLKRNPVQIQKIGFRGREKASKVFSIDRYISEWKQTLEDVVKGNF